MKAVILGGGYGGRLFGSFDPEKYIQKGLLPVAGKPAIEYGLAGLAKSDEIDEIIIVTNRESFQSYRKWLADYEHKAKVKILVEPYSEPGKNFGVVSYLYYAVKMAKITGDCVLLASDNVFDFDSAELIRFFGEKRTNVVGVHDIGSHEEAKSHAVLSLNTDGKVIRYAEKPKEPFSTDVVAFFYVLTKETISNLPLWLSTGGNPDRFGDWIAWSMLQGHDLHGYRFGGEWFDIGTEDNVRLANLHFMNKQ
jgi:NDP-sugar pyrophosphorylase family protein